MDEASQEKMEAVDLYLEERHRVKKEKDKARYRRAFVKKKDRAERRYYHLSKYKMAKGCHICGYNTNPRALYFHHLHKKRGVKIAVAMRLGLHKLFKEIRVTKVTCANCTAIMLGEREKDV